ncbi:4-(cytidine 5'-diphospho)-2-C-methyl-D-erythritol kinase [Marinomonas sp. GJ51-6]|uniref:4-(cytidine 5'-diphospho)-2-C-methyl-D-erythritol kinase n=1 Tax=Marinomonas sp. GJ51-6 TaxID=2992802 RepID=UPI0029349B14|nr:4-(cytidine 5'-diphospho)-2-C-methyl-D-erythritol kinase [Marinomonas sp. GJ51-6]WOD06447.1 4-(cytidine 5'-diphospho)-2-C-methyl-D-erythritol kinase [Marinomonas sp. GJ51-6]
MGRSVTTMRLPSPAKLNLFLHITGRREDGYHELQTVFQFIDLCDTLEFSLTQNNRITISPEIEGLPTEENLIYKAAKLLAPFKKDKTFGVDIRLEKQLPMGGGIGGGSSNAATTLLALNTLWECHLTLEKLAEMGVTLGADIPVFVMGFSAFAEGVGERLQKVEPDTPYFLLLKPNCHVSTAQIFTDKYLTRDTPPIKIPHALKLGGHNDCLDVVKKHNPEVNEAYLWLKNHGDAKLTGTGACLFLAFDNLLDAERVKQLIPKKWQSWVCRSTNTSPTHDALNQWIEQN